MFEGHIAVAGTRLWVRLEGREDAPVVVLVHSLGTELRLWDEQIPALAASYKVLRYHSRGHGRSEAPSGPYSVDLLASDLLGLLAHFAVQRAHVVGVSLGALTAIAIGLRSPPVVASIAVCDTRTDVSEEFAQAIDARNVFIRANGMEPIARSAPERWLSPITLSSRPDLVEKVSGMVRGASPEGFIACAEAVKTAGLDERLSKIRLPALFVAGTDDPGLPVQVIRNMQRRINGSRFAEIPSAGHLSPMENPAAFNAALLQFLADVDLPAGARPPGR